MRKNLLAAVLLTCLSFAKAQDTELDSLLKVLKTSPNDTNKLKLLSDISDIAPDGEWQKYSEQMRVLAEQFMKHTDASIQKAGKKYYSISLNNKGFSYFEKGDFKNALDLYSRSMKLSKEVGDYENVALELSNIGATYDRQGEAAKAIEIYEEALKIELKQNKPANVSGTLLNIGSLYNSKGITDSALVYYQRALSIVQKNSIKNHTVTILYYNLGVSFETQGNLSQATEYYTTGLKISELIGDKSGKAGNMKGLASVYFKQGDAAKAMALAKPALAIAVETENLRDIQRTSELLKRIHQKQGNFKEAFDMYVLETSTRDSLARKENEKAVLRNQFQYDYDLKEATAKAEQEKKDGIANAELKRQKVQKMAFLGGFAVMVLFAGVFFRQRNKIGREKKRSDELLLNILPEEVAEELKTKGEAEAKHIEEVTVLFTDFKGFTTMSEKLTPKQLVRDIHECFSAFDHIMEKYGMEKIKTIGDSYMAAGGLPVPNKTHATDAIQAAIEIRAFIEEGKARKIATGQPYFEIRIGIHTGPVVAGIVGVKKFAYDIWGDTVNTASRMESSGEVGQINISETTYALVKDKFTCEYRGEIEAKNKGKLKMYFVG